MPNNQSDNPRFAPNCDLLSDSKLLSNGVIASWPTQQPKALWPFAAEHPTLLVNGNVTTIPVVVNSPYARWHPNMLFRMVGPLIGKPLLLPYTIPDARGLTAVARALLANWADAAQGRIDFQFTDQPLGPFERALFINFCGSLEQFNAVNLGGFATLQPDRQGSIHNAVICLPEVPEYVAPPPAPTEQVIIGEEDFTAFYPYPSLESWARNFLHEAGHALGLLHLHELSEIYRRLQELPDIHRYFCSVMPYYHFLGTDWPEQPQALGPLDQQLILLALNGQHATEWHRTWLAWETVQLIGLTRDTGLVLGSHYFQKYLERGLAQHMNQYSATLISHTLYWTGFSGVFGLSSVPLAPACAGALLASSPPPTSAHRAVNTGLSILQNHLLMLILLAQQGYLTEQLPLSTYLMITVALTLYFAPHIRYGVTQTTQHLFAAYRRVYARFGDEEAPESLAPAP